MPGTLHNSRVVPAATLALALALVQSPGAQQAPPAKSPRPATAPTKALRPAAPRDPRAEALRLNTLGAAYMNQQQPARALQLFEQAYALDATLLAARLNQGIALLNLQKLDGARAVLEEATAKDPASARAWYNLGLLERASGETAKALAAFQRATGLAPDDPDAHYFVATLHADLQQTDAAIAAFNRAIQLNPFHVSANFGLARLYQRLGRSDEARTHLVRFQRLTQEKLGAPLASTYGDQGALSLAEMTPTESHQSSAVPVKYVVVPGSVVGLSAPWRILERTPNSIAACSGQDVRGQLEILLLAPFTEKGFWFYRGSGGRFMRGDLENLEIRGAGLSCAMGDFDNDGELDVAVGSTEEASLWKRKGAGALQRVFSTPAAVPGDSTTAVSFLDYDHDGDLDFLVQKGMSRLFRNNGNGTFTEVTGETGISGQEPQSQAIFSDINNDRAIDLIVPQLLARPLIFLNPREGAFVMDTGLSIPIDGPTLIVVADFDRDSWMDIVVAEHLHPALALESVQQHLEKEKFGRMSLWHNIRGKRLDRRAITTLGPLSLFDLVARDFDNDGWLDLLAIVEDNQGRGRVICLRNRGQQFEDVTSQIGLGDLRLSHPRGLVGSDFDGDGDTDFLVTQLGAPPVLLRNDGGNRNNWLKLSLKGLADNKSAIGTKVEVYAGGAYQKFEVTTPNDLLIGLGKATKADVVRLLWPTGVLQDEVNLAANKRHVLTEIDRRGSSCPIVFTWNGSRYEFIADAIGPGIVGHWVAPGERNVSDPTEYIRIPGASLRPRSDPLGRPRLSVRFMEPMEELVYLDQLRLLAVDHPAGADVYPNERFYASGPPFPDGRVIATMRTPAGGRPVESSPQDVGARLPVAARDHRGRDVLPLLAQRDRRYVTDFADAPYKGFADLHWIELDLGDVVRPGLSRPQRATEDRASRPQETRQNGSSAASGMQDSTSRIQEAAPLRLLLHGYTDYFTATSVYAAHQAGVTAIVPYVEALDAQGRWVRIEDDMGFPAGLARTMVADLTGKLPAGARRIRIVTNLKVYWDQVLVDTTPAGAVPVRVTEAPLASAALAFRGYPREVRGTPASDYSYDYAQISATGPYARPAGHYTRYGDVRALVAGADDRFVILGSGDEVAADFDSASLPSLPAGWTRDYFLYVDGFAKDMDFYAAHAYTVEPLPHHSMGRYPTSPDAGNAYPTDPRALAYQLEYNTRPHSGRPPATYRYTWPPPAKTPR